MKTSKIQKEGLDLGLSRSAEHKCPLVIVLDRSGSMRGQSINELNAGLATLKASFMQDPLVCLRVEITVISFSSDVRVDVKFVSPDQFDPPVLIADGETCLGSALGTALDLLNERKNDYRTAGTSFYKPWLVLITDAVSSDDVSEASRRIKDAENRKRLNFFPVGVSNADMQKLWEISNREPLKLDGLRFVDLFDWVSMNVSSVSTSMPGDQVALTPTSWAQAQA